MKQQHNWTQMLLKFARQKKNKGKTNEQIAHEFITNNLIKTNN